MKAFMGYVLNVECYQISDDDLDDCDDDGMLDDAVEPNTSSNCHNSHIRGPYERAWTTEATRALIHVRGPMEGQFTEGRHKRTALWLQCTRQMQKMGFRYNAAKVQKKWHNILITYNKNLCKKYTTGYVHWEFFEEMFRYLQGKKANYEYLHKQQHQQHKACNENTEVNSNNNNSNNSNNNNSNNSNSNANQQHHPHHHHHIVGNDYLTASNDPLLQAQLDGGMDGRSNDDFDEDDSGDLSEFRKPKLELKEEQINDMLVESTVTNFYNQQCQPGNIGNLDNLEIPSNPTFSHKADCSSLDQNNSWWQEYFERKLQVERDKLQLQREMHQELMEFHRTTLRQQEKIERTKIDAIVNLTSTLNKLADLRNNKNI